MQRQTVAEVPGFGLRCQAHVVERPVQHVTGAVAGEHPAGPVPAVRGGCQPDDRDRRVGWAEAGHRSAPVLLVPERRAPDPRDLFPPPDQARAGDAAGDPLVEVGEALGPRGGGGGILDRIGDQLGGHVGHVPKVTDNPFDGT